MRPAIIFFLSGFIILNLQAQTDPVLQEIKRHHDAADYAKEISLLEPAIQKYILNGDKKTLLYLLLNKSDIIRDYGGINLCLAYISEVESRYADIINQDTNLRMSFYISRIKCYQLTGKWSVIRENLNLIDKELSGKENPAIRAAEMQLWMLYYEGTRQVKRMNECADSSLMLAKSGKSDFIYLLADAYYLKGLCALSVTNPSNPEARKYLDSALLVVSHQPIANLNTKSFIYQRYGLYYYNKAINSGLQADYDSSKTAYLESIKLQEIYGNPSRIAYRYNCLGWLGNGFGKPDEALKYFHQANKVNLFDFKTSSYLDIPELQPVYNDYQAQIFLPNIALSLIMKYKKDNSQATLEKIYELSIYNVLFYLEAIKNNADEKMELVFYPTYDQTIGNFLISSAIELYKKTGIRKYLEEGFYYASLTKYTSLLLNNKPAAKPSDWNDLFFDTDSVLFYERELITKDFSYKKKVPDLDFWKPFTSDSTVLLDYYYNYLTGAIAAIILSKDSISVKSELPLDSCVRYLDNLNTAIKYNDSKLYEKNAYLLYQGLIPGEVQKVKNLIIIPYYDNSDIPFEALVETVNNTDDFRSLNYLVKKYNVRYLFNPHIEPASVKASEGFLIICPDFGGDTVFSNLPFCLSFSKELSARKKSSSLFGQDANRENILKSISGKKVIHISSHMICDYQNTDRSLIISDNPGKNSSHGVSYYQIINVPVNADLVVLNGCSSSKGKLLSGEGFLSFSSAFRKAGAHSVIATVRNIDDKSSSEIMALFYSGLDKGLKKSFALRQSKLDYIRNSEVSEQANPYYWNGYVYYGEDGSLDIPSKPDTRVLIGVCCGLIVAFALFFFWRTKKKRKIKADFTSAFA